MLLSSPKKKVPIGTIILGGPVVRGGGRGSEARVDSKIPRLATGTRFARGDLLQILWGTYDERFSLYTSDAHKVPWRKAVEI